MSRLSLTFSAAGSKQVPGGDYIFIEGLTDVVTLEFIRHGTQAVKLENIDSGFYTSIPGGFDYVKITSATAQTVKVIVLIGEAGYNRLSGIVEVVDSSVVRSGAGEAFQGQLAQIVGAAGEYCYGQLWNPAANTKRLIVRKVGAAASVATYIQLRRSTAALANLSANSPVCVDLSVAGGTSAELRYEKSTTIPGGDNMAKVGGASGVMEWLKLDNPVIVKPGYGLMLLGVGTGFTLDGAFLWDEEAE